MLENSSKMTTRDAMIALFGRAPAHGEQPRLLEAVVKATKGVSYRTARSLWNDEIKKPDHLAAQEIMRAAAALQHKNHRGNQNELQELRARLARLESLLVQTDSEFHRGTIDLVGQQMRRSG